jgi:predicted nucleotidyltransferase component of viral defense system
LVTDEHLAVASLEDIAAMKLAAIIQRGTRRDYFDLSVLLERFGLKRLLDFASKKYKGFNEYIALQALTYFEDAEHDPEAARLKPFASVGWEEVKRGMERHVRALIQGA